MHSPLDLPIVQALSEHDTHPSLRASATAWLAAYDLAHQLGFNEGAALGQADTAWDRAAEPWPPLGGRRTGLHADRIWPSRHPGQALNWWPHSHRLGPGPCLTPSGCWSTTSIG